MADGEQQRACCTLTLRTRPLARLPQTPALWFAVLIFSIKNKIVIIYHCLLGLLDSNQNLSDYQLKKIHILFIYLACLPGLAGHAGARMHMWQPENNLQESFSAYSVRVRWPELVPPGWAAACRAVLAACYLLTSQSPLYICNMRSV